MLWRARPGRMEEMTVPLDTVNDIRSMDAAGRSRSEIARMLHVSRNTVAKYADMEDMSPAAPMPQRRGRPALEGNEEWVIGVLEANRMDSAGRRRTLRSIGRASESSGFEAACEAALRVVEGGRVPDDATVDVLARRIAGGGGGAGGADLSVYDGFLKGAVADGS